jgi:hypothetical protein
MTPVEQLQKDYPWIQTPLIVGAPMRLISLAELAVEITKAGMFFDMPKEVWCPAWHLWPFTCTHCTPERDGYRVELLLSGP